MSCFEGCCVLNFAWSLSCSGRRVGLAALSCQSACPMSSQGAPHWCRAWYKGVSWQVFSGVWAPWPVQPAAQKTSVAVQPSAPSPANSPQPGKGWDVPGQGHQRGLHSQGPGSHALCSTLSLSSVGHFQLQALRPTPAAMGGWWLY